MAVIRDDDLIFNWFTIIGAFTTLSSTHKLNEGSDKGGVDCVNVKSGNNWLKAVLSQLKGFVFERQYSEMQYLCSGSAVYGLR